MPNPSLANADWTTPAAHRPARAEWLVILPILIVAAALRLPLLGSIPPAINQDEAMRGYDAWCLWKTGADYTGTRWPAFFYSFGPGDYPSAVSSYLTAPIVGLFGLSPFSVRLPMAMAGLATIGVLWWWVRREIGPVAGLCAAAAMALSPWHQQVSRMAFEGDLAPFFMTLGFAAIVRRDLRPSPVALLMGGICLGIGAWCYHAPRVVIPLLIVAWVVLCISGARDANVDGAPAVTAATRRGQWGGRPNSRAWILFAVGLVVGASPLVMTLCKHPEQVLGRARQVTLLGGGGSVGEALTATARHYAEHFNPRRLFAQGDNPRTPWLVPSVSGFLHYYEAPLLLLGVLFAARQAGRSAVMRFFLVWLLIYPLPASVTRDGGPHMIRDAVGLPATAVFVGLGAAWVLSLVPRGASWRRTAGAAMALIAVLNAGWYEGYYFGSYASEVGPYFQSDLAPAFTWLREHGGPYDAGVVAIPVRQQPFVYHLFFSRIDPREAQTSSVRRAEWVMGFDEILQFGRFRFNSARSRESWSEDELMQMARTLRQGSRIVILARPGTIQRTRPAQVVHGIDGRSTIEIHEWVVP